MKTQANTTINDTDQLTDVLQAIYRRHHNKAEFSRPKRLWVESAVRNGAPEKQAWDEANACQDQARKGVEYARLMNQLGAGEVEGVMKAPTAPAAPQDRPNWPFPVVQSREQIEGKCRMFHTDPPPTEPDRLTYADMVQDNGEALF